MRQFQIPWTALTLAALMPVHGAMAQSFQSPSGNIHCMHLAGDPEFLRCDIGAFTPSYPVRPADCEQDYGFAFELAPTGAGYLVCAGDTVNDPAAPVLAYGDILEMGAFVCQSERAGMNCRNATGGGFFISRRRQSVF